MSMFYLHLFDSFDCEKKHSDEQPLANAPNVGHLRVIKTLLGIAFGNSFGCTPATRRC